ncbi:hypothetical protein [Streptomyces rimosus]|uniref:hypothetical protein n=1 Tax=Streptomyces rimosus TaxID=1927 RepID=UPI0004BF7283|nr:hypothetical protein [Streptomyces rimosus]
MTVYKNKLGVMFTGLGGSLHTSLFQPLRGRWTEADTVTYFHTQNGPGLAVWSNHVALGHRNDSGKFGHTMASLWDNWGTSSTTISTWTTTSAVSMATLGDRLWFAGRTADGRNRIVTRVDNSYPEVPLPSTWSTSHGPSIVNHQDRIWLVARGSEGQLQCLHGTGGEWTRPPAAVPGGVMEGEPGLASHDGKLYVMYRR